MKIVGNGVYLLLVALRRHGGLTGYLLYPWEGSIIQFSVGTKVQILRQGSHYGDAGTVADYQVAHGNPATSKWLPMYQVKLTSGETEWFEESDLDPATQESKALSKSKSPWFPTVIAVGFGVVALVLGTILFQKNAAMDTPQKAVLAYMKHYPKAGKDVVLAAQPVEYYDGGAYLLGKSSDNSYVIFYAVQNSQRRWVARAVTAFSSENFVGESEGW